VFTSVNPSIDGTGHCLNGPGPINCNIYTGKRFVWLNGGPAANKLRPAGKYFFAVGEPGFQSNPNDGSPKNLSCPHTPCVDPYTNRTFTVGSNGEITAYTGTHDQGPTTGGLLLRLCLGGCPPFNTTTNNGGEYDMTVCYLGVHGTTYPVTASNCKHDAFKVVDETPPVCTLIATIPGPPKQIQVMAQDVDSGIASITVTKSLNADTVVPPFVSGTTAPVLVTSTKINQAQFSILALHITDVAGNSVDCDPVVPGKHMRAHPVRVLSKTDYLRFARMRS